MSIEVSGRQLADNLLQLVTDDALLGDETLLTYDQARTKFGIPGTNQGMGKVLDEAYRVLKAELGEQIALGVVAYVVNAQTQEPGIGWDEHLDARKAAVSARSDARAALRARRIS